MNKRNLIGIASTKSGKSVDDICSKVGISKEAVEKWDENPFELTFEQLKNILDYTGLSYDDLFDDDDGKSPVFSEVYQAENEAVIELLEAKRERVHSFRKTLQDRNDEQLVECVDEVISKYDNFADITLRKIRKPVVCAFGKSDTGKSTLINYLLNEKVAHANYNPLTSAIVYYHHIDDMPEYLRKKNSNAFVFGIKQSSRKRKVSFTHADIFEATAEKYLIANDSFDNIMDRFGTRKGENYLNKDFRVFEIDVFLENKVLHEITLIDIPGFESNDKDDDIGLKLNNQDIDVVFYLSIADGFMRPEEHVHLRNRLISRNHADGVFVLATHAQGVGGPVKAAEILDDGCKRFFDELTEQFKEENALQSYEELRERFYAFDVRNAKYCRDLNDAFVAYIEALIKRRCQEAENEVTEECKRLNSYYVERKTQVAVNTDFQKKSKKLEEEFLNNRKSELRVYRAELKQKIGEYRAESLREFSQEYEELLAKDNVVSLMTQRGIKNKQDDIQLFADYMAQLVGDSFKRSVSKKSELFTKDVDQVLEKYQEPWMNDGVFDILKTRFDWFDFRAVFASGLTGVGTIGALTVWAGVTAAGSNLGAYILVAKIASALSISSVSAVQAVSALGGPVVFAATLAVIAALGAFGIFSSSWKTRTAAALIKQFAKEKTKETYLEQIEKFWDGTIEQLDVCLDTLESKLLELYRLENAINIRILEQEDKNLQRNLSDLYGMASDVYWDIAFSIQTFDERKKSDIFYERKKVIGADLMIRKQQNHRYKLNATEDDLENLIFMDPEELLIFWNDLEMLLDGKLETVSLSGGMGIYQRDDKFSIYYVSNDNEISIRYVDVFIHKSSKYESFKNLLKNTYPIKNDQIRYKVFDMFRSAQKEILILMPWLNDYGWDKEGLYSSSVRKEIVAALKRNPELHIKIFVGYDLENRDDEREEKTRKKALKIQQELKKYGERLEIITDIGTHEKKITVDDICALSGSFNLLSNEGPYQKQQWAADSMDVIENYTNIERQRREILERANRIYMPIVEM